MLLFLWQSMLLHVLLLCLEWHHSKLSLEGSQHSSPLPGFASFLACRFGFEISSAVQLQPPAGSGPIHALSTAHWKARHCGYDSSAGYKDVVGRLL